MIFLPEEKKETIVKTEVNFTAETAASFFR